MLLSDVAIRAVRCVPTGRALIFTTTYKGFAVQGPDGSRRRAFFTYRFMSAQGPQPIAIYYEHPDWFRPLFNELDRRGTNYVKLDAARHHYDATNGDGAQYGLVRSKSVV